jgi:hypothetical protein
MDSGSLDEQRREFASRPLIATPIAGAIAWSVVGIAGYFLSLRSAALVLFIATGMIPYLGMLISRFTGENFLHRSKPMNSFDVLFLYTCGMSFLVYAIAIPFFLVDRTSLPMTVGVLSGLMWIPITWIIQHWVGVVHAVVRTVAVVAAWYVFPTHRFVAIPVVIVVLYAGAIAVLVNRPRGARTAPIAPATSSSC